MPIDLNWVRTNPAQVEEWQIQRGRSKRQFPTSSSNLEYVQDDDFVGIVQTLDQQGLQVLHELRDQRTRLKQLQKSLRPTKTGKKPKGGESRESQELEQPNLELSSTSREEAIQEMKQLQAEIQKQDQYHKELTRKLQNALCYLASPIDPKVTIKDSDSEKNTFDLDIIHVVPRSKRRFEFQLLSNTGLDISQAMLQYTRKWLLKKYSPNMIQVPCTIPIQNERDNGNEDYQDSLRSSVWSLSADKALQLWGPTPRNPKTPDTTDGSPPTTMASALPAWVGVLAKSMPPKSFFGAKQLPQFTAIWGNGSGGESTMEVLAMCPGTLWDSRTIQSMLVKDLIGYYQSLLLEGSWSSSSLSITTHAVQAYELEQHELSRIGIVASRKPLSSADDADDLVVVLGWVSNFGDAVSRACDMGFRGGGWAKTKDYVHLIHATVLGSDTISGLLDLNTIATDEDAMDEQLRAFIPRLVVPHLVQTLDKDDEAELSNMAGDDCHAFSSVSIDSILSTPKSANTVSTTALFAPPPANKNCTTARLTTTQQHSSQKNKAPFLADFMSNPPSQERIHLEALTAPFDFLGIL